MIPTHPTTNTRLLGLSVVFVLAVTAVGLMGVFVGFSASNGEDLADEPVALSTDGGEPLELDRPSPAVTGETELEPGTELQVTVESDGSGDTAPFQARQVVTVEQDNSFTAEFDLEEIVPGTAASVSVYERSTGEQLTRTPAVVTVPWRTVEPGEFLVTFDGASPPEIDLTEPVLSGSAAVESGTELEIQIQTEPGAGTHLFEREMVTTDETGAFELSVDTDDVQPGTDATVSVRKPDRSVPLYRSPVVFTVPEDGMPTTTAELVEFDDAEPHELVAGSNRISGTAAQLDAGDEVEITVRAANLDIDGLPVTQSVAVDRAGRFVFNPELDHVEPGIGLRLEIEHPETTDSYVRSALIEED